MLTKATFAAVFEVFVLKELIGQIKIKYSSSFIIYSHA